MWYTSSETKVLYRFAMLMILIMITNKDVILLSSSQGNLTSAVYNSVLVGIKIIYCVI